MKVSFITTIRNEERTIGPYLESLSRQTRIPDEVVIVDGGSNDRTVEEIRARANLFDELRVIEQPCNIAAGRNIAVNAATGEIIVMSDAGCVLDERWVEEIIRPFEDPATEISAGNWNILREEGLPKIFRWHYLRRKENFQDGPGDPKNPSARSFAIRKSVWHALGGHPEHLYAGEDTLFNEKCRISKCNTAVAGDAMCYWVMHRHLGAFGRQLRNYARAGGRLARRRSLLTLMYYGKRIAVSALLLMVATPTAVACGLHWWIAGLIAAAGLCVLLLPRKLTEWVSARRYGLTVRESVIAVVTTYVAEWNALCGTIAGFVDRSRGDFEAKTLEYLCLPGNDRSAAAAERRREGAFCESIAVSAAPGERGR